MLCVSYAPFAPIGICKSQMISVVSITDGVIEQCHAAGKTIQDIAYQHEIKPSFLEKEKGNVFVVSGITKDSDDHNYHGCNCDQTNLTSEGKASVRLLGNALVSGALSSLDALDLPNIENLVTLNKKDSKALADFTTFRKNGEKLWKEITADAETKSKWKRSLSVKKNEPYEI